MPTNKKVHSIRINEQAMKQLKHLAVDTDKSLGTLLYTSLHFHRSTRRSLTWC